MQSSLALGLPESEIFFWYGRSLSIHPPHGSADHILGSDNRSLLADVDAALGIRYAANQLKRAYELVGDWQEIQAKLDALCPDGSEKFEQWNKKDAPDASHFFPPISAREAA